VLPVSEGAGAVLGSAGVPFGSEAEAEAVDPPDPVGAGSAVPAGVGSAGAGVAEAGVDEVGADSLGGVSFAGSVCAGAGAWAGAAVTLTAAAGAVAVGVAGVTAVPEVSGGTL
jgi:hypothetical protein